MFHTSRCTRTMKFVIAEEPRISYSAFAIYTERASRELVALGWLGWDSPKTIEKNWAGWECPIDSSSKTSKSYVRPQHPRSRDARPGRDCGTKTGFTAPTFGRDRLFVQNSHSERHTDSKRGPSMHQKADNRTQQGHKRPNLIASCF